MPEISVQQSMSVILGLLLATGVLVHAIAEEIASPLKVAQCRAACVHAFTTRNDSQKMCTKNPDCLTCWENCQLLQSNFPAWGHICSQKATCYPGCETACRFMNSDRRLQKPPVIVNRGEEVLSTEGEETKWPPPDSEIDGPWVYIVVRRLNDAWRQITQTLSLSAKIPYGGSIRVLVVGREGLFTIYSPSTELPSPRETARNVIQSLGQHALLKFDLPRPGPELLLQHSQDDRWNLRQVSVVHQQVIVMAEVAWEPKHSRALYLVTWEVDGGGIQGNLFTDSTTVTLSLWPDTKFHVQVELVGGQRSEVLVISTRREEVPKSEPTSSVSSVKIDTTFVLAVAIILTLCCVFVGRKIHQKLVRNKLCDSDQSTGLPPIVRIMELPQSGIKTKDAEELRSSLSQLAYQKRQLTT